MQTAIRWVFMEDETPTHPMITKLTIRLTCLVGIVLITLGLGIADEHTLKALALVFGMMLCGVLGVCLVIAGLISTEDLDEANRSRNNYRN